MGKNDKSKKEATVEDSFKALDKIISQMDDDSCSLEKSLELYEKGVKIISDVTKKVDKIEKDLKILDK